MSEAGASLVDEKLGLNVVPKTKASDSIFPERLLEGKAKRALFVLAFKLKLFVSGKYVVHSASDISVSSYKGH